jgi:hypothetical protein
MKGTQVAGKNAKMKCPNNKEDSRIKEIEKKQKIKIKNIITKKAETTGYRD